MTIRTLCEVCKKVIRYTDDRQQVQEAIDNPNQFCEGHIAEPNEDAIKGIMKVLRSSKNPDNAFFISKVDGHLMSHAYINRKDGSYFPTTPKNSYELDAGKRQSRSYMILREHLHDEWLCQAREPWNNP